ncbi:hypothetical protein BT96DRAFT_984667 [Gymnopus androsaceus JB14]|uniref:Uncharacterized protein n=1 Tax=Gymnopus androsaceus JB14 TaxID=1447944 RepID=A0A6A4IGA4_9AGAR|nr:hypothetical protein BT96DRAFT_984667 [Gymnopus androsaceus JB14]
MTSPLHNLLSIIQNSADEIEAVFEKHGLEFPSINDSEDAQPYEGNAIRLDPSIQGATTLLISAASLQMFNSRHYMSSTISLGVAMESDIVEILREAGPKGMHVEKIAERAQIQLITS